MKSLFASSSNPENLSLTIKGALVALVPIIIGVFQLFNIELTETALMEVIQNGTALLSAAIMFLGAIRKAFKALKP